MHVKADLPRPASKKPQGTGRRNSNIPGGPGIHLMSPPFARARIRDTVYPMPIDPGWVPWPSPRKYGEKTVSTWLSSTPGPSSWTLSHTHSSPASREK